MEVDCVLCLEYKEAGREIYMYARHPNPHGDISNRDIQQARPSCVISDTGE